MDSSAHSEEITDWQKTRDQGLRDPAGWLTLAGLFWLQVGANSIGSAPDNKIQFLKGDPHIGTLYLSAEGQIEFKPSPNTTGTVTIDGNPASSTSVASDLNNATPTKFQQGSLSWWVIFRSPKYGIRLKDSQSPVLQNFTGMKYFPTAPHFRFEAEFEPLAEPRQIKIPTPVGFDTETSYGAIKFTYENQPYQLTTFGEPSKPLWILFRDQTTTKETYGGGRFLYSTPVGSDNKVVVDFNKAYNPPCVFTEFATCPLPPSENRLPFAVTAGELSFGDH